ncbi:MAG: Asp-tRNA(Asn)/Glu-tRNA(Gln) amidotransferase subunit GatA [Deltaproteobacteria bacterium]|nr:Asp-tRNA(Asn)/Glu-tRNA(Gln) amidotransferase subunit GatA [Deltaproteobacteria bacterium]
MELYSHTIHEAHEMLKKREISAVELTKSVCDRIDRIENKINAFVTMNQEEALASAEAANQRYKDGTAGPLTGIPLGIKDVICTKGLRTTCSSKILENYIPPYDAMVMTKLREAGAVIVGKTNMDEFAMGSSTEPVWTGPTRNPWSLEHISGGSSGGSAAAVAADECLGALGSDTGGSIRQPAAHCGVAGLKPTYGRVSRYGLIAYGSSLDQIGPITKDVTDLAIIMNSISGYDPQDSTSVPREVPDYTAALTHGLKGIKIGLPKEYFISGIDPEVMAAVKNGVTELEKLGAEVMDVSLPHTEYVVAVYYVIAPAEASSNLARYDGVKYGFREKSPANLMDMYYQTRTNGFGPEVIRRIIMGTYVLSAGYYDAYYHKASQVRTLIRRDFEEAFKVCDVLVTPVAPTPAFKIGQMTDDPLQMYLSDIFTLSANMAGIPGMSVPCGFSSAGLPIGMQLMAGHFNEETLLKVGFNFESATGFHKQKPTRQSNR